MILAGNSIYVSAAAVAHRGASRVCLWLGECAWTGAIDNTFGQPSGKS